MQCCKLNINEITLYKIKTYREEGEKETNIILNWCWIIILGVPGKSMDYQTDTLSTDIYKSAMTFPHMHYT